jgi:hypothetical protein
MRRCFQLGDNVDFLSAFVDLSGAGRHFIERGQLVSMPRANAT